MPRDEFSAEDPLELVWMVVPGESRSLDAMAEALVEEYVRMGWTDARLMTLFTNPVFQATHRIYRLRGERFVRDLIQRSRLQWGILPKELSNA